MDFTPEAVVDARPPVKEWKGEPVNWVENKHDGHRMTVIISEVGQAFARGRKPTLEMIHELKKTPCLKRFIDDLPARSVVELEVCGYDAYSTSVVTAIKAGEARFAVLAVPFLAGKSYTDVQLTDLRSVYSELLHYGVYSHRSLEHYPLDWKETRQLLVKEARKQDIEGFVVKNRMWSEWYKIKPVRTGDFIVLGKSQRAFYHDLKALKIGYLHGTNIVEVGEVGSGFTHEQRKQFWADAPQVVEVEFDSVNSRGKLRFPTFIRVRDGEKDPGDCRGEEL